jgi:putative acetyltransferase
VLIRREAESDVEVIRAITVAAFTNVPWEPPGRVVTEGALIDELRQSEAWIPALSMVAVSQVAGSQVAGEVIGHVLCTRAHVDDAPVLALGPVAVRPDRQRTGVGQAMIHAVLGAGDALDEPLVALIGDPRYYCRFGFRLGVEYGITPPVANWEPVFQVRPLTAYRPSIRGAFRFAEPFDET